MLSSERLRTSRPRPGLVALAGVAAFLEGDPMGVDPKAKDMTQANSGQGRGKDRAKFVAAMRPPDEMIGAAICVVVELLEERHDADPRSPIAKISVARLKGGEWCASANDWDARLTVGGFGPNAGAAICALASKLVAGEPWKALPDR